MFILNVIHTTLEIAFGTCFFNMLYLVYTIDSDACVTHVLDPTPAL